MTKPTQTRIAPVWVSAVLAVLGVVLIVVSVVYFSESAGHLPSFFPGHVGSHSAGAAHKHTKHGIAALLVGLAAIIGAWLTGGTKKNSSAGA